MGEPSSINKLVRVVSGAGASSPHLLNKSSCGESSGSSSKLRELVEGREGRQDVDIEANWTDISEMAMIMTSGWALIASCCGHVPGIFTEHACPHRSMSSPPPASSDETATS